MPEKLPKITRMWHYRASYWHMQRVAG